MRSVALTALFFALFGLFSTVAYAAPVAPQGSISKRAACQMSGCRDAVITPTTSDSDLSRSAYFIGEVVAAFYDNIMKNSANSPDSPPASASALSTCASSASASSTCASSTSSAPAYNPTGL